MNINFFKTLSTKICFQDVCNSALMHIFRLKNGKEKETIVACDGHLLCIAVVTKKEIEEAIYRDILVAKTYNKKRFYSARKFRHEKLSQDYPNIFKVIPDLKFPVKDLMENIPVPKVIFNGNKMRIADEALSYYRNEKPFSDQRPFRFTHYPVAKDQLKMHAHIEPGILIGLMPIRPIDGYSLPIHDDINGKNVLKIINK